ncbi:MAG: hypothetical protein ACOX7H_02260 [Bacillota bacterium]|jgi:putative membrane protein (TIGR04086 family)
MAVLHGLKASFLVFLLGGLFLFIAASIATEPFVADIFYRVWMILIVFIGGALAGFKSKKKPIESGFITGLVLLAIALFTMIWFVPIILSPQMIFKTVGGTLFFSLLGAFWGLNLAKAKKAAEENNQ